MLILSRRPGESIIVAEKKDDKITSIAEVVVLGIKGNQVRIGIEADEKYPIHRLEIFQKIKEEEQQVEEDKEKS